MPKKKEKPTPPKFEITAKRTTKLGKYQTALYKWLKVIFWHYDELKEDIDELKRRLDELEKSVKEDHKI